jgi:hypothetical protein
MPKIYDYLGFIFFFYSNEHAPIHCHVKKAEKEVKAELEYADGRLIVRFKRMKGKEIFDDQQLSKIEGFIKKEHLEIVEKWKMFFIFGKSPTFEKINSKS